MNTSVQRRWHAIVLTALLSLGVAATATGCKPQAWSWKASATHGAIVEFSAGRASLGIYRQPRSVLHDLYRAGGIRLVQDAIWAVGQPPAITKTFTYRGRSITTSFGTAALRRQAHDLIYRNPSDLRRALLDAQSHRDCLALTLVSYGKPAGNWTHKAVGCQMGRLP